MTLLIIVVIVALGYFYLRTTVGSAPPSGNRPAGQSGSSSHPDWLEARWALARKEAGQASGIFPPWYFDPMTEHQANRLTDDGKTFSKNMTKGQASDLIGLGEPAEEEDLEILRFFKQPMRGMNGSRARHEVAVLFAQTANRAAWEGRPATTRQAEFFRFFATKPTKTLSMKEAEKVIQEQLAAAEKEGDARAANWRIFDQILSEFDDPDFRDNYDLKKPTYSQIRAATSALLAEGKTWTNLGDDTDLIVDKLIEQKPDLEK